MTNASGWGGVRATHARQYLAHRIRAAWAQHQQVTCPRCQLPILPGETWDVGHDQPISTRPDLLWSLPHLRPEHASCNRADGAHITNTARAQARGEWKW